MGGAKGCSCPLHVPVFCILELRVLGFGVGAIPLGRRCQGLGGGKGGGGDCTQKRFRFVWQRLESFGRASLFSAAAVDQGPFFVVFLFLFFFLFFSFFSVFLFIFSFFGTG